ncbi:hypothetical protein PLESTB_001170100 [Pleodorina starrii]|uniref:Transmembrane protein 107 n=1 Tax=Pleodorina starrii TaxID=330485 RepID=A0A9W6BR91_9CHLO|nr:hypothetical protein PLESTM_000245900 [Pleodorina starrii]GLC56981.1 hypothetical protein PLESTB_001170100 [Pleodorina starrii]GLC64815.1 hypothetical protein PLESTF_000210400 [Pleodorina starrii]
MAPFRPEEVTLPSRFLCKTAHLVAIVTVLFDVEAVVGNLQIASSDPLFDTRKQQITGLCYAAIGCFAVDYVSLFLGISMFFPAVMSLNILAHFVGTILVVLFYTDNWSFDSFVAFFAVFNVLPMLLEVFTLVFVTRFSFLKY